MAVDDDAVFEIKDFSVSSPWEVLIADIEEAVRAWLEEKKSAEVPLSMAAAEYTLLLVGDPSPAHDSGRPLPLPRFMRELLGTDFTSVAFSDSPSERLQRWFGLSAFVLLVPKSGEVDADEMALLQGALCVALAGCACALPAFVLHDAE